MTIRVERSELGYGTHVWLGSRVRLGTPGTMTPMLPRVYKSGDEYCNDVLALHLYPVCSIDIWWRWRQRTVDDGWCDKCKRDYREAGFSDLAIARFEAEHYLAVLASEEKQEPNS